MQQLAGSSQDRQTCVEGPGYLAEFSAQDESLLELRRGLGWKDAGCLNSGFSAQNWGEDLVWLHADSLKGLECTGSYHLLAWDGVRAHQRSPIIIMQRVGDASAMGALLSTASQ